MVAEDEEHSEDEEEEEGEGEELDVKEIARKAPEWSVGIIIYNNAAYPIARSKYAEGEFYFSTSWRAVKKGVKGELVILKDGSTHKYRVKRRGDKYIQVVLLQ